MEHSNIDDRFGCQSYLHYQGDNLLCNKYQKPFGSYGYFLSTYVDFPSWNETLATTFFRKQQFRYHSIVLPDMLWVQTNKHRFESTHTFIAL